MWFFLSLFAGFLFAANRLIVRSVLTKKVSPMAFGAVHEMLAGLLLLPVGLYFFSLPHNLTTWIALALGIFFIFLCDLFAFLALKHIEASLYQIIGQLRHIVVLLGAFLLFTEAISLEKIISIILIIVGVSVAMISKSKIAINRGTMYALVSTICIALAFLFIKVTTVDVSPAFSSSVSLIISGLLMYLLLIVKRDRPKQLIPTAQRRKFISAAVLFAFFELSLFTALSIGEASKVTPVTQSSMIFTLIGGYVFLNERTNLKQKIIGSVLIAIGIGLLYFIN